MVANAEPYKWSKKDSTGIKKGIGEQDMGSTLYSSVLMSTERHRTFGKFCITLAPSPHRWTVRHRGGGSSQQQPMTER